MPSKAFTAGNSGLFTSQSQSLTVSMPSKAFTAGNHVKLRCLNLLKTMFPCLQKPSPLATTVLKLYAPDFRLVSMPSKAFTAGNSFGDRGTTKTPRLVSMPSKAFTAGNKKWTLCKMANGASFHAFKSLHRWQHWSSAAL